jgi:long-subunit fatty acid transport protein
MEGLDLTLSFHMQTNMNFDREYADCPADVQADGVCTNTETGIRDVSRLLYETVEDGFVLGTFRTDIPAQLNIGASYVVVPDFVRLEASFAYFFHGLATWGTEVSPGHPIYGQDKGVLYVDGWEAGLGVEFDLDVVLVSAGALYAKNGATEESLSYLFWGNDAVSVATGATWIIDDSMTATLGITYARYFPTSSEALGMDYDWWALDVAAGMTYSF